MNSPTPAEESSAISPAAPLQAAVPSAAPARSADALPRILLKPRRAQPFHFRHPWVYRTAVHSVSGNPQPGDEVAVYTHEREFLGRGLFNPNSQILVRLYGWNPDEPLDAEFWERRLDSALALRRRLPAPWGLDANMERFAPDRGCRLVFSEADGLSGLTVDRYGDWLLLQFTSLAIAKHRELFLRLLVDRLQPRGIWLRTEKGMRENEGLETVDGLAWGDPPPRPLVLEDHGIRYQVDVVEGQKTGFYLDQSANRAAAARYCRGGRMLDLFCYSGGFALTAARHGAASAIGFDVSDAAISLATRNAAENGLSDRVQFEKGKAFDALERLAAAGERFDAIVLDPPKMARNRASLPQAMKGYYSLNRMAVDLLQPGGILVTCSCTGLVSSLDFHEMLSRVGTQANRSIRILENRAASPDHPTLVHCPETDYLKCVIATVD